jgi:hypothetical protein
MEHDPRGLGVDPNVVLRCRSDITYGAGGSPHDHAPADLRDDIWRSLNGERHIGERAKGHQFNAGVGADHLDQNLDRMDIAGCSGWGRVVLVTQAVIAVKEMGVHSLPAERVRLPAIHRHISAAEFDCVERVPDALVDGDVAQHDGDRHHVYFGAAQCHDQGHCIVGRGVRVDQELAGRRRLSGLTGQPPGGASHSS